MTNTCPTPCGPRPSLVPSFLRTFTHGYRHGAARRGARAGDPRSGRSWPHAGGFQKVGHPRRSASGTTPGVRSLLFALGRRQRCSSVLIPVRSSLLPRPRHPIDHGAPWSRCGQDYLLPVRAPMAAPPAPPTRAPVKTEPPVSAPMAAPPAAPTTPPVAARCSRFVSEHPAKENPTNRIQTNLCAILCSLQLC
jgi:hypothetical protein